MTLDMIKENNRRKGHHWFSRDTMRFFQCRVSDRLYPSATGAIYFVTSERRSGQRRRYTVRVTCDQGATIDTVGEFQAYSDRRTAHAAAAYFAETKGHECNHSDCLCTESAE